MWRDVLIYLILTRIKQSNIFTYTKPHNWKHAPWMARTSCGESPPTPWICASQRATILRRVCILRDEQKIVHVEVCPRTSSGACGLDQQKIDSQQPTTLRRDSTVWWRRKSPNGEVSPKHFIFASSECRLEQSTRHNAWPKVRIIIRFVSGKICVDVHIYHVWANKVKPVGQHVK